jgi:hypothetical protein
MEQMNIKITTYATSEEAIWFCVVVSWYQSRNPMRQLTTGWHTKCLIPGRAKYFLFTTTFWVKATAL